MAATPSPHSREGEWIVADIGGTHARFGYWRAAGGLDAGRAARYRNDDFADIAALIDRYRRDHAPDARQALLALALPVGPGPLRMTNRDWVFSAAGLRATLGLSQLLLVNDFVAAGAGTGSLLPHEVERIGGAARQREATLALGPGTGLGVAATVLVDGREHILASEAGHMSAAPGGADARAACAAARARFGRVSWERLLCGDGLALLDATIRGAPAETAAAVAARAQAGDAAARRAARAFAHALGEFAGDLCLAFRATGGVYLTGGVLQGLGAALDAAALRDGFEDKGRFAATLREVPCYRVGVDNLALRGLARLLDGSVRAPVFGVQAA
jgi:glucokinase